MFSNDHSVLNACRLVEKILNEDFKIFSHVFSFRFFGPFFKTRSRVQKNMSDNAERGGLIILGLNNVVKDHPPSCALMVCENASSNHSLIFRRFLLLMPFSLLALN